MSRTFSCQEPAPRTVPVILSAAELAAVILFHVRQQKRVASLAGRLSLGLGTETLTPPQIGAALEECQTQHAMHEARAMELSRELKRAHPEAVKPSKSRTPSAN